MTKTSVFKDWKFGFKTPCGCGHIDESGWQELKYNMPVLYLDSEIIAHATVGFIYCPACGIIEQIKV
jgi:hypothetical protein